MELNDEQIYKIHRDAAEQEAELSHIFNENLEFVKQNISYPFECIEEYINEGENYHVGYVHILKDEHYKEFGYSQYDFYSLCPEDQKKFNNSHRFMRQDDNEENDFHCLVWQTCGCCEDDYSGYLLFPLKNGTYWMINFYC